MIRYEAMLTVYIDDEDGGVEEIQLPQKMEVCPRCHGHGKHTNPSIDGNGITASEMDELGDDFREDYLNGVYDVRCERCGGANVVPVVDEDRCDQKLLKLHKAQEHERALAEREAYYERRMEMRGY